MMIWHTVRITEKRRLLSSKPDTHSRNWEVFKITHRTYYQWIEILETSGSVKVEIKRTRKGRIDPDALKKAVEEKPDAYLRELSGMSGRSPSSVYRCLVSPG
jgi:hypothetical protein